MTALSTTPETPETVVPTDSATRAIDRTIRLHAAPDRVWRALTDPDEISRWFGDRTSFRAEPGAAGWFEWDEGGRYHCRVEAVDAPRRIAWRWAREEDTDVDDGPSTLVEWDLLPSPSGGTVVHLRESGFVDARNRTGNGAGWLEELADLFAALADEPWQAGYRQTYRFTSSPERVWQALSDPDEIRAWQGYTAVSGTGIGTEIWTTWPDGRRVAIRIDAIDPPNYRASSHTIEPETSLADATEVLTTEFFVKPREDGGTDVLLFETGHLAPERREQNSHGWDEYLIPIIRQYLGEAAGPTT
jgi:uncharacterized protein YndB with AHSA1/START domain